LTTLVLSSLILRTLVTYKSDYGHLNCSGCSLYW